MAAQSPQMELLLDVRNDVRRLHERLDVMQAQLCERCNAHHQRTATLEVEQREMKAGLKAARELAERRSLSLWQWVVSLGIAALGWFVAWYRGK